MDCKNKFIILLGLFSVLSNAHNVEVRFGLGGDSTRTYQAQRVGELYHALAADDRYGQIVIGTRAASPEEEIHEDCEVNFVPFDPENLMGLYELHPKFIEMYESISCTRARWNI